MSDEVVTDRVSRVIKKALETIEHDCEQLRAENRAKTEKKLEYLCKWTSEYVQKYRQKEMTAASNQTDYAIFVRERWPSLTEPFNMGIFNQLSSTTAADVIFYYLMKDGKGEERSTDFGHTSSQFYSLDGWYELCSCLFDPSFSTEMKELFKEYPEVLELLIRKHPTLLLNRFSAIMLRTIPEYLLFDCLHNLLITIKDETGRTCLFSLSSQPRTLTRLYQSRPDKLFELLSIQDENGQTALHVNPIWVTELLIFTQIPQQHKNLIALTKIQDKNNETALDTAENWVHDFLSWLINQIAHDRYVLYRKPNVLILYNTKNRPGAEEEAQTIYNAFGSKKCFHTEIEKDKTSEQMLELIKTTAKRGLYDMFGSALIVVILSHGRSGVINCYDKPVSFSSIESAMCQEELQNRPKILVTQCCQIRSEDDMRQQCQKSDASPAADREQFIPKNSDFCAIMSCVPGEFSERNVFIPKLAEQIERCKENETIDLLVKRVSKQMDEKKEKTTQTPIILTTLKSEFCPLNRDPFYLEFLCTIARKSPLHTFKKCTIKL